MTRGNISIAKITKPCIPEVSPRERLYRLLDAGMRSPVIWISAPPGAGKTSLVAGYLTERDLPYLWYQLDERDADIATYSHYMGLAVQRISPDARDAVLRSTTTTLSHRYFEEIYSGLPSPFVLVFDEYQDISPDSGFHQGLCNGITHTPEGITIIIMSRREPPSVFARLRANRRIFTVGWQELRFTLEESRRVITDGGRGKISEHLVNALHERMQGWAAGLVVASDRADLSDEALLAGSEQDKERIFDYFARELFEKAGSQVQEFLLRTAFLPSVTTFLAERLSGAGAGKALSFLSCNHYFTEVDVAVDGVCRYTYHPLFKEFLLARAKRSFSLEEVTGIQRQCAALLIEAQQVLDAVPLLREAKDWQGLIELALGQSPFLMAQEKGRILEEWLESVPGECMVHQPWAVFWLGMCKQLHAPVTSRLLLERAFHCFVAREDTAGTFLAWAGGVDTFHYDWDDVVPLGWWVERLEELMFQDIAFPSAAIEARVTVSMTGALILGRPHHPHIEEWTARAVSLAMASHDSQLRMQAIHHAFNFYVWRGDVAKSSMMAAEMGRVATSPDTSQLSAITRLSAEALLATWSAADHEVALESVRKGLETIRTAKGHEPEHMLLALGVYAALGNGDAESAGAYLMKMGQTLQCTRGRGLAMYNALCAWHSLALGKASRAVAHGEAALRGVAGTGSFWEMLYQVQLSQALHAAHEHQEAGALLARSREAIRGSGSLALEYLYLLTSAQFALDRGGETAGLVYLRRGMALGRKQGYVNMLWWWLPTVMTMLCCKALEAGIEVAYVQHLIRTRNLMPDIAPIHIESWPWPIRIYTLGRFGIIKEGAPMRFSGKIQQKPLALLKALIAFGGRDVSVEKLTDLLWPEAEGDFSYQSLTTNLHRLRRLLGNEKAIKCNDGKVTLDSRYCWLDAWAFERLAGSAEVVWAGKDSAELSFQATGLVAKAMELYTGHFLVGDSGHSWAVSTRERLRSKALRLIGRAGAYHETCGDLASAIECYMKGLTIDDHIEEFYQRLMICHHRLGRPGEALATYARCRMVLATIGSKTSARSRAGHEALLNGLDPQLAMDTH